MSVGITRGEWVFFFSEGDTHSAESVLHWMNWSFPDCLHKADWIQNEIRVDELVSPDQEHIRSFGRTIAIIPTMRGSVIPTLCRPSYAASHGFPNTM